MPILIAIAVDTVLLGLNLIKKNCMAAKNKRNKKDKILRLRLCLTEVIGLAGESTGASIETIINENRKQKIEKSIIDFSLAK